MHERQLFAAHISPVQNKHYRMSAIQVLFSYLFQKVAGIHLHFKENLVIKDN